MSSASGATARTVTAGQHARWRRSAASASARTDPTRTRSPSPTASTATARKRAFLATESTSSASTDDIAAARGRPGNPPPLPRSMNASAPAATRQGSAVRLSATWRIATSAGSRIEVRLIEAFHATSSRTCPSIADRADGASVTPRPARASSSASSYATGSGGQASTRVGSGSRGRSRHPSSRSCLRGPSGLRSRRRRSSHRSRRRSSVARPVPVGFPRTPRKPRYPGGSVRMPDVRTGRPPSQPGYPRIHLRCASLWKSARTPARSVYAPAQSVCAPARSVCARAAGLRRVSDPRIEPAAASGGGQAPRLVAGP